MPNNENHKKSATIGEESGRQRCLRAMLFRCVLATTLFGIAMTITFVANYAALSRSKNHADVSDIVGRQRMLINLAGLTTERLVSDQQGATLKYQAKLRSIASDLQTVHQMAIQRDGILRSGKYPSAMDDILTAEPHRLDQRMEEFVGLLRKLAATENIRGEQAAVQRLREIATSEKLLQAQEALAQSFKDEMHRQHRHSTYIALAMLLIGLATRAINAVWVFRPMIRTVRKETQQLAATNELIREQRHEISAAKDALEEEREERRARMRAMASMMEDLRHEQAAMRQENEMRQRIQKQLAASEKRFYSIIESAPTAMVMIAEDGRIALINAETEKLFGFRRDELLNQQIEMLMPERFRIKHPEHRDGFFAQPATRRMGEGRELFGRRKDGTEFPLELGLNPISMAEGLFVLSAVVDITERKRAEGEIRRINHELRQKNDEMQQFVYTVSHDLKSPIVTCKGFLGLMKEDAREQRWDEMLDSVGRVERATERMGELIDDLLQLSRIGVVRNDPEMVDVRDLVQSITDDLAHRLKAADVALTIDDDLPSVFADRVRLEEVFENLLSNAVKYGCGGDQPQIRVGGTAKDNELHFFVQDNGQGIAPQYHERIFGLFQRLHADKDGTGVGLAAVARIMDIHQGRVWVESEEGCGTTFWLSFPDLNNIMYTLAEENNANLTLECVS